MKQKIAFFVKSYSRSSKMEQTGRQPPGKILNHDLTHTSMKVETFEDDLIGLKEFSSRLERFIAVEHRYVEGSLVVGLSSRFGSGKTSFLKMWTNSLAAEKENEKRLVIPLNAWESDYYGDPLFAIISALASGIKDEGESAEKLVSAAKDVGHFIGALGNQLVRKVSGVDPVAAGEHAEKKKKEREDTFLLASDTFSAYEGRKKAMAALKKAVGEFAEGTDPNILFLVDELDRCRPDYAISYLETIKHIFDIKGVVFLLAADRQHLENSAKTAFGPDLDFEEYYRKFIHREVTLPDIPAESYGKIASKYVSHYLDGEGSRNCFMKLDQQHIDNISEFIGALKLTPRQIQEVFRTLGHIFDTSEENKGRLLWGLAAGSIMMAALKVEFPKVFHSIGIKQLNPNDFYLFLSETLKEEHVEWWFTICLTGGGLKLEPSDTPEVAMRNVGLWPEDSKEMLQGYSNAWGRGGGSNRFAQIYENIERLQQWG